MLQLTFYVILLLPDDGPASRNTS